MERAAIGSKRRGQRLRRLPVVLLWFAINSGVLWYGLLSTKGEHASLVLSVAIGFLTIAPAALLTAALFLKLRPGE
ncbi:MAG: hypothetical protein WBX25_27430 [Rhodomicrobium sp.]